MKIEKIKEIQKYLYSLNCNSREKIEKFIIKYKSEDFIIAGSWAIEILSKKKLNHSDIDLIFNGNSVYYIDDAKIEEEQCFGIIPLDKNYFEKNFVIKEFHNKNIKLPSFNFQIAIKIIGELRKDFTSRAQKQIKLLLENYDNFNKEKSLKEIKYIFENTTPKTLEHDKIAKQIIDSIILWKTNKRNEAMNKIIKIHSEVNSKLREEFSKRGLNKKIKISEVDI